MQHRDAVSDQIAEVYSSESRRILATLIRLLGDIDRAEEALQEAFSAALTVWPKEGVPENPRAWLVSAGKFRGIDALRRQGRGAELALQQVREDTRSYTVSEGWDGDVIKDDQLRLIFTCCHPVLPIDSRIALTLREMCGLTTEEIAHSFLVPVETMKKRISRAKAKIRKEKIPYEVPSQAELPERLHAVLHVVYLVYNEGYSTTSGPEHQRRDLAREAVSLARRIVDLLPESEATGLLALLLFHESRSAARVDARGDLVSLEEQDRTAWDRDSIAEAVELVRRSVSSGRLGIYALQAAIASVHAAADTVESTRWDLIVGYYDMLTLLQDSPFVALNRAIAVGMRDGPAEGLAIVDDLLASGEMSEYHRVHAVRADLALRAGLSDAARESYGRAIKLVRQEPERRYLQRRLAEISE